MHVGDGQVDRPRAGELLRHREDRFAIARTQARIDHQHRLVADDVTNVRNERDAVVRNQLDMFRDWLETFGLDEGRRRRRLLGHDGLGCQEREHRCRYAGELAHDEWPSQRVDRAVYPCSQRAWRRPETPSPLSRARYLLLLTLLSLLALCHVSPLKS